MAKQTAVWGIDVGHCALKALRCTLQDGEVVAEAFDYIEYPKILSQPEADAEELVREALEQFLSRNDVKGDRVAISVPGQSGLAKFFKPPPVDAKKIPDIVKYEARQQIPFDLQDVIWDYQRMAGGNEVDGFALDTEVGLFAMKREQVYRAIKPFQEAGIELDIVQLAPLSIYNFVTYDMLVGGQQDEGYDPENPPESIVVLSLGTDSSDLVVTNGVRVWQRSIPLGGNHFTKQLTKDLKLTFAKAEHLKRNAREAEDPKTVFQAMRPVFNDLVTEVQRSLGFFQSIDKKAKIRGIIVLGNTVKLPGLKQYLSKNLGYDIVEFDRFSRLNGSAISSPTFKGNNLSFGVSYGLCLQGLEEAPLQTNLVPREILTERLIRQKKPWAVAAIGLLLLGCAFNFFFYQNAWSQTDEVRWETSFSRAQQLSDNSQRHKRDDQEKVQQLEFVKQLGEEVAGNADRRILWLELLKAINTSLPYHPEFQGRPYPNDYPMMERPELHIEHVESKYFEDLSEWFTEEIQGRYAESLPIVNLEDDEEIPEDAPPAEGDDVLPTEDEVENGEAENGQTNEADQEGQAPASAIATQDHTAADGMELTPPEGEGWVIELKGYHYFNADLNRFGANHVRQTLLRNLEHGTVRLPARPGEPPLEFTMKELGIQYPTLVRNPRLVDVVIPNPEYDPQRDRRRGVAPGDRTNQRGTQQRGTQQRGTLGDGQRNGDSEPVPPTLQVKRYDFVVQFCWQENPLSRRLEERVQAQEEEMGVEPDAASPDDVAVRMARP